jgi:hypothetical protein
MKFQLKGFPFIPTISFLCSAFLLMRFAKISYIVGSTFSFFSLSDVVMPLSGLLGIGFSLLVVLLRGSLRMAFGNIALFKLVYHIPGLCASAYWASENKLISLIIPALCMAAFVSHPVGFAAAPYSFYWLIPMALYFVPKKTIFMHSLASTFVAHAVGSVLWLYLNPAISVAQWYALLPVVAVERLLFASAMTLVYYVGAYTKNMLLFWSQSRKKVTTHV